jgi:hypothetical protein
MGKSATECAAGGDGPQYRVAPRRLRCQRAEHAGGARPVATMWAEKNLLCLTENGNLREMTILLGMELPAPRLTGGFARTWNQH